MEKPAIPLEGQDGNIFSVMGAASKALRRAGQEDKAIEMRERVTSSKSYDMALAIICEYIDFD